MERAFEAMGTGSVDLNWAKQHHRPWFEEKVAEAAKAAIRPPAPPHPAE